MINDIRLYLKIFFISAAVCFTVCYHVAGTGSETTNSAVVGTVYQPDGVTPAEGATVSLRPERTLADTTGIYLQTSTNTATETTDDSGRFSFDTEIDTGIYIIEAEDGDNNRALVTPVEILNNNSTKEVTAYLQPAGVITGTILLSEGGDMRNVFICVFGINRFTMPDSSGEFTFDSLAKGVYDMRIITVSEDYAVFDTSGVEVYSAGVTDLDTLVLSYTGVSNSVIPLPENLVLAYDTLKQVVALSWEKCDTELVNGYAIYRRHSESDFEAIAMVSADDTVYCDSSVVEGMSYEYRISAFDKADNEGTFTTGVNVEVAGAYELMKVIGTRGTGDRQFESPRGITGDTGCVYIADYNLSKIEKYDLEGTFISGFSTALPPFNILLSHRKNLVICTFSNYDRHMIVRVDTSGAVIDTFEITADIQEPYDIAQDGNGNFYVANRFSNVITVFNENGDYLKAFGGPGTENARFDDAYGVTVDDNGVIYVTDGNNNRIHKFRTDGTFENAWGTGGLSIGSFSRPTDVLADTHGFIYVMEWTGRRIQKFDTDGNAVLRFGASGNEPGQFGKMLNCIWVDDKDRLWISEGPDNCRIQIFKPRLIGVP